jgi:hypothetical protein
MHLQQAFIFALSTYTNTLIQTQTKPTKHAHIHTHIYIYIQSFLTSNWQVWWWIIIIANIIWLGTKVLGGLTFREARLLMETLYKTGMSHILLLEF